MAEKTEKPETKKKTPKTAEEAAEPKHAHTEQSSKPKKEETDSLAEKEEKEEKPEKKEKPAKKAKQKEEKKKEVKERIITIKFRATKGSSIGRRKNKVISTVRAGVQRGHKDKRVVITMELNHKLWSMGRNKLPNSIKVRVEDDGETLKTSPA
ncbi:Uncharacterised protein [uncultured archaeon]|nr:Uncharacterised protein [uncultured archaeon]